jgi:putative transposase
VYHVCNRGSRKGVLFESSEEYDAFVQLMAEAREKRSMRILAYCLMPTHVHFLLWPEGDSDLPRFMKWLTATHAQRRHREHRTVGTGAVYQSRYVAVWISDDRHYFSAVRYIERNALAANLVERAEEWRWCSAWQNVAESPTFELDEGPLDLPDNWLEVLTVE